MVEDDDRPLRVHGDREDLAEVDPGGELQRVGQRVELQDRRPAVVDSGTLLRVDRCRGHGHRNGEHVNTSHGNLLFAGRT